MGGSAKRGRRFLTGMVRIGLLVVVAVCCAAAAEADREYEIRLHRPDRVGCRYDVSVVAAVKSVARRDVGGRSGEPQETTSAAEMQATAEILAVNAKGDSTRIAYTIEKLVRQVDGRDEPVLAKGQVVVAEAGKDQTVFTLKDGQITNAQRSALHLITDIVRSRSYTMDDYYPAKKPQKVGGSWVANSQVIADDSGKRGRPLKKEDISGPLKLDGLAHSDGFDCLRLKCELKIARMPAAKPQRLPPGMKLARYSFETSSVVLIPDLLTYPCSEMSGFGSPAEQDVALERVVNRGPGKANPMCGDAWMSKDMTRLEPGKSVALSVSVLQSSFTASVRCGALRGWIVTRS